MQLDQLKRRELIVVLGQRLRAQQLAMPVIGLLHPRSRGDAIRSVSAFRRGLAETDFVEGKNLATEYRFADGEPERLPALAAELVPAPSCR